MGFKRNGIRLGHKPNGKKNPALAAVLLIGIGIVAFFLLQSAVLVQLPFWPNQGTTLKVIAADKEDMGGAKDSDLTVVVDYGYDQYVKYGRFMNITAAITNNGKDFNGWVQVMVPKTKNNVVYRRKVNVASQETTKVSLSLPVMDDTGYLQFIITDKNGTTIGEKKYKLKIGNYENLAYVGIISNAPENLEYLKEFGTRIFYLDENNLSDDYKALDLLDVIVINQYDTALLSDSQIKAIEKWVMNGGTLVIGTGEYSKETLSKLDKTFSIKTKGNPANGDITFGLNKETLQDLKQDIVDYEEERKIFLETIKDRNDMLKAYGNDTISVDTSVFQRWSKEELGNLKIESVNKKIADVWMKDSSAVIAEGSNKLMQSSPQGHGKVQIFSFDLGLNKEDKTIGLAILNEISKNMSNTKITQLEEEYYGSYLNYGVFNSMSNTNAKEIPKVGKYIIMIAIYICIIGPVTFILLRKLDKRSLIWAAVPVTAIVFTLLVYFVGSDTRIDEPYAGYVKLLNFEDNDKVNEEFYFALTAPSNHTYSIPVDNPYDIIELRGNGDNSYLYDYKKKKIYYDDYTAAVNYENDKTTLEVKNNPAFSPVYYQWEGSYDMTNRLTYNIHYIGDKVYGTVTNGFDFDISNAMLTSDGYVINIGEIKKGETISLEGKDAIFMTTRDELYNTDIINRIAGGTGEVKDNTPQVNRLSNVLYYLTENNLLDSQHTSCIIGFVEGTLSGQDKNNNVLGDLTKNMKAYGTTAVKLPVEVNYTMGDKEFVPSIDPYIIMSEGNYNKYYQSRYLNSDSMTIKYHLPERDKIVSFEYLSNRNQDSSNDYLSAFDGAIYFLNAKTGNYDEVFKNGPGSSVTDINNYLSEQNTITVRYSTKMSLKGYQMVLPYISYWKEAGFNAGN
jgi:hypothetical protein